MRPYSLDLRERVLADYDLGMSTQAISKTYRISTRCIRGLRKLREETGQLTPRQGSRGPPPKLSDYSEQLTAIVQELPDATLEELQ